MLHFNPDYTHKADQSALKLQLELVELVSNRGGQKGYANAAKVKNKPDNVSFVSKDSKFGNNQDYLLARLKRDNPEIVSRIEKGEFKSVRQAALAAGIVDIADKVWKKPLSARDAPLKESPAEASETFGKQAFSNKSIARHHVNVSMLFV